VRVCACVFVVCVVCVCVCVCCVCVCVCVYDSVIGTKLTSRKNGLIESFITSSTIHEKFAK